VRPDRQAGVRPLVVSHGANSPRTDRSRFRLEFDWTGTADPTAFLAVPAAIGFLGGLLPGGWPALMARNRATALAARSVLARALGIPAPGPPDMVGALATVPLPGEPSDPPDAAPSRDSLQDDLLQHGGFEVLACVWPALRRRLLRVSAACYNGADDYRRLAVALRERLGIQPVRASSR
jgi:isopenicillin-N epimerase